MASAERGSGPAETLFTAERMLGYLAELDAVLADEGACAKQRGSLIDFDQLAAAVPRLTRRLSKASTVSSK